MDILAENDEDLWEDEVEEVVESPFDLPQSSSKLRFDCDTSVNFYKNGPKYKQIDLTDACQDGVCDANPVYGRINDNDAAIAYCEEKCNSALSYCEGFFF